MPALADAARASASPTLGYDNVELRVGDGTLRLAGGGAVRRHPGRGRRAGGAGGAEGAARRSAAGWSCRSAATSGSRRCCKLTRTGDDDVRGGGPRRGALRAADRRAGLGRGRHRRPPATHVPAQAREQRLPELIAEAAEPLPDLDDPAFGRLFDRFADRRVVLLGEASHGTVGVLPRPRGDHPAADRAARLHHRRGRGRLAGRGARSTAMCAIAPAAPAPSRRSSAFRPGCGATPRSTAFVDWLRAHNAGASRSRAPRGLLRPRPLQHERLDRGGARLSRQGRSRSRARSRASATAA